MKNIVLLIYFILFIQYVYNRTISIESKDIPDELIDRFDINTSGIKKGLHQPNIGCDFSHTIFCKDNVCVNVSIASIKPFIELPDKNGYIHRYILIPYALGYDSFINQYIESNRNETISVSTDCKLDSQCFSNKCLNNTCTYNVEANVERCDLLYTHHTIHSPSEVYTNCGRMLGTLKDGKARLLILLMKSLKRIQSLNLRKK